MAEAHLSAQQASALDGRYGRFRVLVADDQTSILDLINTTVAKTLSATVVCRHDGDSALAALEQELFDVFVTDMMMPGMRGFELLEKVQQLAPEMDVIVMTGYPEDFPYVEIVRAGADDFINKPFPPSELVAKLIRLFDERELRRQRRVAESKYKSLFELSVEGMLCLTEPDYRIVDVNHAFLELTGLPAATLNACTVMDLLDPAEVERLRQWLTFCKTTGRGMIADVTLGGAQDTALATDITATIADAGEERLLFLSFKDVTDKRERDRLLARAAERDELTGLYNRRAFNNRMDCAVSRAKKRGTPVSLMLIDLDNFKQVNDSLGHAAGDDILRQVGTTIRDGIRRSMGDEGFRFGGDEFAVLLPGADKTAGMAVAERLRAVFSASERHGTSMSIGLAVYRDSESLAAFTARADQALYKAKEIGKNAVCLGR